MRRFLSGFCFLAILAGITTGVPGVDPVAAQTTPASDPSVPVPPEAEHLGEVVVRSGPLMSGDGTKVFIATEDTFGGWQNRSGHLESRDVATGAVTTILESDAAMASPFTIWDATSDGSTLLITARVGWSATSSGQDQLFKLNVATGALTEITTLLPSGSFSTSGIFYASMSDNGQVVSFRSTNKYLGATTYSQRIYISLNGVLNGMGSLAWSEVLADGRVLLPGNADGSQLSVLDPYTNDFIDVDLPIEFVQGGPSNRLSQPRASDDGSVIGWIVWDRVFVWDRDLDGDGNLDEDGDSQIYEPSRAVAGYYGTQNGPVAVSADGSQVAFTSDSFGFPCTSSRQPESHQPAFGPSFFSGGKAVVSWSRTGGRVEYVAEFSEFALGSLCGIMPSVSLSGDGAEFAVSSTSDLSAAGGLANAPRVWVAPVDAMVRRDVSLTLTNVIACQDEVGGFNDTLCPQGGSSDSTNQYASRVWFGDAPMVETALDNRNDLGDIERGEFRLVSGTVLEVLPAVGVFVELVDDYVADGVSEASTLDISAQNNRLGVQVVFEPSTGDWRVEGVYGAANQSWIRGNGEPEGGFRVGNPAILGFDLSALEPDPSMNNSTAGDVDGDGLLDGWELHGLEVIDVAQDHPVTAASPDMSVVIDPAWNAAQVDKPDIFVENDWLSDGTVSAVPLWRPKNGDTYAEVVEAFELAPVPMSLWIDTGDLTSGSSFSVPTTKPTPEMLTPTAGDWGLDLDGGNEILLDSGDIAGITRVCEAGSQVSDGRVAFNDVKDANFDINRRWVFRYALTGHKSIYTPDDKCGANGRGGQAEIGGDDILLMRPDAVVLMHELGHSLNLKHGGNENLNCKPNYVSVMNYAYDRTEGIGLAPRGHILDFSPARLPGGGRTGLMPDLDEKDLDERVILDPGNAVHYVRYSDVNRVVWEDAVAGENLDYSGDRADPPPNLAGVEFETSVQTSVNYACRDNLDDTEEMSDHDDWGAMRIPFRQSDHYGNAGVPDLSDETGMMTEEEGELLYLEHQHDVELSLAATPVVDGQVVLTASVLALDTNFVNEIRAKFEFSEGVTAVDPLIGEDYWADGCLVDEDGFLSCWVGAGSVSFDSLPTPPVTMDLSLSIASTAVNPAVTVSASHSGYPLENDPDPTNNVVTLNLAGGPQPLPPVAVDDSETAMAGETISIDVLTNDTDPDENMDEASLSIVSGPMLGSAEVVDAGDGPEVEYTAGPAAGVDSIVYQICDDGGLCDQATVTITILTESDCTITGTSGHDTLVGTEGADVICGLGGDDTIDGLGGNDVILGGKGADTIHGGGGDDTIIGGPGADKLYGDAGNDVLKGRRGNDVMNGGEGNDELRGGKGADVLKGNQGNDTMFGGRGADVLRGGSGDDVLRGRWGDDELRGGQGADRLYGGRGADELFGGVGDDELYGRRGPDFLNGGPGSDVGRGGRGQDTCLKLETSFGCEL